ncbi:uncharacterized protein LOC132546409 [Ylistrum balloti]|uniref:uncharacterized protein LOC132546409 n=1 Tax=Ylistrum balloti TaxID=509963 RepID=UPI002905A73F|nr:uncharacterized protein LOC132546409 [Ylistrum balloti]
MALENGCIFAFSILSISFPFVKGKGMEPVDRIDQIRQLIEKLGSADDDQSTWHASIQQRVVGAKFSVPDSTWSVDSNDVLNISYFKNAENDTKQTKNVLTTQNTTRHTSVTHAGLFQVKPLIDSQDPNLWLGVGLGALASLSVLLLGLLVWNLAKRYSRRKRCIDLTELSFCSLKEKTYPAPVYVRLSQLHNPRKRNKGSHYVVSVLDESNNFSIDSESESSSSEEEIFNVSGYKSSDNSFSQYNSGARVNLTSTPIKGSPSCIVQNPPITPPRSQSNCRKPLPISPLARRMPYNTPPEAGGTPDNKNMK